MLIKKLQIFFFIISLSSTIASADYEYDPNDFAIEVIEYVQGSGIPYDYISGIPFNDAATSLGQPTIDTTGDDYYIPEYEIVPVLPVYAPFRSFEIVTVGKGGLLTVKFNHRVVDDKNNLYGIDFIVFGNSWKTIGFEEGWINNDPATLIVGSGGSYEPGTVSVSQDGQVWYSFTNGPFADDFAPTLGRIYDPCDPNSSIGAWNLWWSHHTNPTLPIDPNLDFNSFDGNSVAEIALAYGESAGGTGFDINDVDLPPDANGLKWFQYVRIENPADSGHTPEIDAISDVGCCGDYKHPFPVGDLSEDCKVDYCDIKLLQSYWMNEITDGNGPAKSADIFEDDVVDTLDFSLLAESWGKRTWNED